MEQKQYKRQNREMDDITKKKISQSLKGRSKTPSHCQAISDGLKKAWEHIPLKGNDSSFTADWGKEQGWYPAQKIISIQCNKDILQSPQMDRKGTLHSVQHNDSDALS